MTAKSHFIALFAILLLAGSLAAQNVPPAPPAPGTSPSKVELKARLDALTKKGAAAVTNAAGAKTEPVSPLGAPAAPPSPGTGAPKAGPGTPSRPPRTGNATTGPAAPGATPPVPGGAVGTGGAGAAGAGAAAGVARPATGFSRESVAPPLRFQNAPLYQVLDYYADLVGRTILRPQTLPDSQVSIKAQSELTVGEAILALESVMALNGVTVIPTGEKFITVVLQANAMTVGGAFSTRSKDELPEAAQFVTHVVQLKNAKPADLVPAIQPFAMNPNGILPIETSRILVLRDYAINVKRMLEMIDKIDVLVEPEVDMELIPIKYALAADMASVLGGLTSGGVVSGGSGRSSAPRPPGTINPAGGGATGFPGSSPVGAPAGTTAPRPTTTASSTQASFQDRLNQIVNRAATGSSRGGDSPILGEARIMSDERSNSLLVFANKQDMLMVKKLVAMLDVVQPQVVIEAIIMEVTLGDDKDVGVQYAQRPKGFTPNFTGVGGVNNGKSFFDFLGGATNAFPGNLTGVLPNGFSYFGKFGNTWEAALSAIATDSSVNVLSRPRIQTSHAVQADLFIGDTVPYITGSTFGDFGGLSSRSTYQEKRVGITLSVMPLINTDGLVVMDIAQTIQQLGVPTEIDGNLVPTTTERNASSRVAVRDGDTIFLGGFISSTKTKSRSGVPYLKDIPGLGVLFRSNKNMNRRVELIVLMRPTVLKTPEIAAINTKIEKEKLSGVRRAELEILAEEDKLRKENEAIIRKYQGKGAPPTSGGGREIRFFIPDGTSTPIQLPDDKLEKPTQPADPNQPAQPADPPKKEEPKPEPPKP